MGAFSTRRVLGVITVVVIVVAALLVWNSARNANERYLDDPRDLVGSGAPVGETVKTAGMVVSCSHRGLVLGSEDGDGTQIIVRYAEPTDSLYESDVVVTVEGTLTEPGRIEDASIIVRTGPTKYNEASDS